MIKNQFPLIRDQKGTTKHKLVYITSTNGYRTHIIGSHSSTRGKLMVKKKIYIGFQVFTALSPKSGRNTD